MQHKAGMLPEAKFFLGPVINNRQTPPAAASREFNTTGIKKAPYSGAFLLCFYFRNNTWENSNVVVLFSPKLIRVFVVTL